MENFAELLAQERSKLAERRSELMRELDAIDRELAAMAAYEAAKTGATTSTKGSGRRTGIRDDIHSRIKSNPGGMTRAEVIDVMAAHDDQKLTQSISNALSALKKTGRVSLQNGTYQAN